MTLVHMHEGETVYYEDSCFVCEAQNQQATEDDSPWSVIESVKLNGPAPYKTRRWEFPWYDIQQGIRTIGFLVAFVAAWLIVIILFDLITRGSVKW